jgi:hypothetical protein
MIGAAENHSSQRGDVAEVAAPGHRDMIGAGETTVGGIELYPPIRGTPYRDPGVRSTIAHQFSRIVGERGIGA